MSSLTDESLRERLREVEDRIARHEIALAFLKKDRDNLQVALQVLDGFHTWEPIGAQLPLPALSSQADGAAAVALAARKPPGTPTVPEMILAVLEWANAEHGAIVAMEPKALTTEIRARWWPDAPVTSVGPIAWRMAKEGKLLKLGSTYAILSEESAEPPEEVDSADMFSPEPKGGESG